MAVHACFSSYSGSIYMKITVQVITGTTQDPISKVTRRKGDGEVPHYQNEALTSKP
jgi:hypothetical protein